MHKYLVVTTLAAALGIGLLFGGCGPNVSTTTSAEGATVSSVPGSTGLPPADLLPFISVSKGKLNTNELTIATNTSMVFWNNEDDPGVPHRFVADDGSFDTQILNPGAQFIVHFTKAETVAFHDQLNPDIKGTVVVTTSVTGPPDTLFSVDGLLIVIANGKLSVTEGQVIVGWTVTFVNGEDDVTRQHHIVADGGGFDTGVLNPGQSFTFTFDQAGSYPFHDELASNIKGTITVEP